MLGLGGREVAFPPPPRAFDPPPTNLDRFEAPSGAAGRSGGSDLQFLSTALDRIAAEGKESFAEVLEVYLAGRELPASFQKNEGAATGFILETLGRQTLELLYPGTEILHGAKLFDATGKEVGELDGIVLDKQGEVLALAEMKMSPGVVGKGRKKLVSLLEGIQDGTLTHYVMQSGKHWSFDEPGPLSRKQFDSIEPGSCFGITVRESAPAPGILRLSVSYRTIAKVASILTYYSGQGAALPCLDSQKYPEKHAGCATG